MQPRHAHPSLDSIAQQLRSTQGEASREIILADPLSDTPIRVSLEQLRPYEHNPRILRNPLHDQLKASIRERGLDQPPTVTRRPGETHYIIRNGGNTRLAILNELWTETADERFFYLDCLFKPWTDESSALLGHLAENDLHAQLSFIERALAVGRIKSLYEQDGPALSQQELARRLSAGGYPVSQSHISRMLDTLEHLLPGLPLALRAGLGKPQIARLLALRKQAQALWEQQKNAGEDFGTFWTRTLQAFDTAGIPPIEALSEHLLSQLEQPDTPPAESAPLLTSTERPAETQPDREPSSIPPPHRVEHIRQHPSQPEADSERALGTELWSINPELDSPVRLRADIHRLASTLATAAGSAEAVFPTDYGLGFACRPSPNESPLALSVQLLLGALLRAHDALDWQDRRHLPAALFGQVLLGIYQLPLPDQPAEDIGLARLPDTLLMQLLRLIRLSRRLIDLESPPAI
ncbi:ParB family protein [Pseudomonas sp. B392_1p]|uniref:ParB family protein n=1 Tax=Pseudomonas sp. B392_1p TaxID=3457507 RepID=UPI003FD0297C